MKRKISFLLALVMLMSVALSSGLTMPVYAADDSFSWAFWASQPAPIVENITSQNVTGTGTRTITINGEFRNFASTNAVTTNSAYADNVANLTDNNTGTKFCTSTSPTFPTVVVLRYNAPITPTAYYIYGANDDGSYARAPSQWTIYGTNNANETAANFNAANWTQLDYRNNQFVTANFEQRAYSFTNTTAYQYLAIRVTGRQSASGFPATQTTASGQTQFSCFGFCQSITESGFSGTVPYLFPSITTNPGMMRDGSAAGWNGANVLTVNGTTANPTAGTTVSCSSYTTVRKDVNVEVFPDTKLSYVIDPQYGTSYDYKLTSCHMAIDLKFTDGTRLKDLGAKDYMGYPMTPLGQGRAMVYVMGCWNFVESNIGEVAAGKIIDEIIVGFEMPDAPKNIVARSAFDDIKIFRRDDTVLIPATELADFTDVRFGTRVGSPLANGACSPLVGTPNAFNYWVPCTGTGSGSPYNSQDRSITYMRISHIASRHMGEKGTLTIRPDATSATSRTTGSGFHKDNEIAHSYYYGVTFNPNDAVNPGVKMEVTPTEHAGVMRFTFPSTAAMRTVQIASAGATPTRSGNTFECTGSLTGSGIGTLRVFGEFNQTVASATTSTTGAVFTFNANPTGPNGETIIELKIGTSFMNAAQAQKNLRLEIDTADNFDSIKAKAKKIWNDTFASTTIQDPTASYWDIVDFYSKYARTCMYPTIMHENTNPSSDLAVCRANPRWQYLSPYRSNVIRDGYFSYNEGFWDTFRSKWTALTFFRPLDTGILFDGVVTHFIDQNARGSFGVPRWINPGGSNLMVMTSSDVIATELYARGVDYDYINGYDASLKSSTVYGPTSGTQGGRFGIQESIFKGYTPWGTAPAAGGGGQLDTSWGIEGFMNDAGTGKMAMGLRDEFLAKAAEATDPAVKADAEFKARQYYDESLYFTNRAKYYTNHFDPNSNGNVGSLGWMRNKNRAGQWLGAGSGSTTATFNALDWGWGFCEDNAYQYVVTVPQDGRGLANLFGGKKAFGDKLEHIFAHSSWDGKNYNTGGYGGAIHEGDEKREVKIGQWGLSNEPGEHMQSMWLFSDRPEEAAKYTRMGMHRAGASIQVGRGMIGEEDNGSMASWWVWAYLGLYPLDQGSGNVVLGSPRFKKVTFNLDDGRNFIFEAPNAGPLNCYVNGIKINGVPYNKLYFTQDMFDNGNVFTFDMSDTPTDWARNAEPPPSLTETGDGRGFGPDILMDICQEGVTQLTSMPAADRTTNAAYVTNIATSGNNSAIYLFDNSSANTTNAAGGGAKTTYDANFTATTTEITYYSAIPAKVEMYTLTSSNTSGADPKAWVLEASNTGAAGSWVELDSRNLPNLTTYNNAAVTTAADAGTKNSETFRWRLQTKPFAIDPAKQAKYKFYRIRITQSSSTANLRLAQVELLADQFYNVTKDALLVAINAAKAIIPLQEAGPVYGPVEYVEMLAVLADAQAVYDDNDAIGREINNAVSTLNAAMAALISIHKAWDRFLAIDESTNNNRVTIYGEARKDPSSSTPATTNGVAGVTLLSSLPITGTTAFYPLANTRPGTGASYKYIDFGTGDRLYTQVNSVYCGNQNSTNGGRVYVRLDSPTGEIIATIDARPTATTTNWSRYAYGYGNISTPKITGIHTVYFEFDNNNTEYAGNFHSFEFECVQQTPFAVVARDRSEATAPPYAAISPVLDLLNGSDGDVDLIIITATYNASGCLINYADKPFKSYANTRAEISPSVVPAAGNKIKVFVWGADNYVPIVPATILE